MYLTEEEAVNKIRIAMNKAVLDGGPVVVSYDAVERIMQELHDQKDEIRYLEAKIDEGERD